jgi:CRISPR/Cas system CSM-associated protein Csm3 (group 7 of RAMP superfamily)
MITLLRLDLQLRTPGGVRAPEIDAPDGGFHVPVARDAWDGPYVPATSLAGSLRACSEGLGQDPARLFGTVQDTAVASPVRVLGTELDLADGHLETRARTAIDRSRAAPAIGLLWTAESLPPGTRVTCYLRLDDPALLPDLHAVLAAWQPNIGGGRTVGQGRAELTGVRTRQIDLATPAGLRAWLTGGGPALFDETAAYDLGERPAVIPETLSWRFTVDGGLHIGTGRRDQTTEQGAPALLARRDGEPYIPGSTWKGLLRSRCEYILRSLGQPACHSSDPQLRCAQPPVCEICAAFGWTGRDETTVGQRSLLWFTDSTVTGAQCEIRQHVALDRVTGGARAGQLYGIEIITSGTVELTVEVHGAVTDLVRALLDLAVADLNDGYLGVGAATTRGLGRLRYADLSDDQAATARAEAARCLAEEIA